MACVMRTSVSRRGDGARATKPAIPHIPFQFSWILEQSRLPLRSPAEILFRLRQEAANVRLLVAPPKLRTPGAIRLRPLLPEPRAVALGLRSTPYAASISELAAAIRGGRIPLLGYELAYAHPIP